MKSSLTVALAAVGCMLASSSAVASQTEPVSVTIDASVTGAPISKYIYGQFLEHGGSIGYEPLAIDGAEGAAAERHDENKASAHGGTADGARLGADTPPIRPRVDVERVDLSIC